MKIRTTILGKDLKEKISEYDLNELETDTEDMIEPGTMHTSSDACIDKTLSSVDLPDGVTISTRPRIRWRRHRLYAQVCYPSDAEEALKNATNSCFQEGVKAAAAVAVIATITPASLAAAVPSASSAFAAAFTACMGDRLSSAIKFKVDYESHRR